MENNSNNLNQTNAPVVNYNAADDEIDLRELFTAIWQGKWMITVITLLFACASIIYAIKQPNIYKATILLAPASGQNSSSGLNALAGQFGGLASLAGVNLGSAGNNKIEIALEVLKSRHFLEGFIGRHEILVPLMASESWDAISETLHLDDNIYDSKNNVWQRDVKAPKMPKPSDWEAYKEFIDIMDVESLKSSGMVKVSIEHNSPFLAKKWLSLLVKDLNDDIREKDKSEAKRGIEFLTKKLRTTQIADMRTIFYQLIEEQTKTIMLAEVSEEYVLKTIDPASAPEEKERPRRALIILLATMLGTIISIFVTLILHFFRKLK